MFVPGGNIRLSFVVHTLTEKCCSCVDDVFPAMGFRCSKARWCVAWNTTWRSESSCVPMCVSIIVPYFPTGCDMGLCICVNVGSRGLGLWQGINRKGSTTVTGHKVKHWWTAQSVAAMFNTITTKNGKCQQTNPVSFLYFLVLKKCQKSWSAIVWHF